MSDEFEEDRKRAEEFFLKNGHGQLVTKDKDGKLSVDIDSKAARFVAYCLTGRFAWDIESQFWHRFESMHWQTVARTVVDREVIEILERETRPIGYRAKYFDSIMAILRSADWLRLPPRRDGIVPFRNGLIDLETGRIEPITPNNALTWVIPHDYVPGGECPIFGNWLRTATDGDAGLITLVRAFFAACLTGRADLQKYLHLVGPGGSGKSTLIRLLVKILGEENCVTTDLRQLEQNRFETAGLYAKRLAMITDANRYGGSVNVLKAITGQDPIRHERKHQQQSGTFQFGGMVLIASNEHMVCTDLTSGIERRRMIIRLDRTIDPAAREAFLAAGGEARLHEEIPAIIAWAVTLPRDEVTHVFLAPTAKIQEFGFDALTAQNHVAAWIAESLFPDPAGWLQIGIKNRSQSNGRVVFDDANNHLYPNYLRWCEESGQANPLPLRRFRDVVIDICRTMGADPQLCRRGAAGERGLSGIRFREQFEEPHPWLP